MNVKDTLCCYLSCYLTFPVCLAEEGKQRSSLAQLNGLWRLLYSSAFAKGQAPSLPGYKLGQVSVRASAFILLLHRYHNFWQETQNQPIKPLQRSFIDCWQSICLNKPWFHIQEKNYSAQVYQGIQAYGSKLDNIVEFYSTLNLPQLPGLPKPDPVILTANLKHYFESVGGSTVRITFQDAELKLTGLPLGLLPFMQVWSFLQYGGWDWAWLSMSIFLIICA